MTWQAEAACVGMPLEVFFDDTYPSYDSRARFVCSLCPVTDACVAEAIAHSDTGIRGGLDERERRRLGGRRSLPKIHRRAA